MTMQIRSYQAADCVHLAALFHQTVHTVNVADYTAAQCDAWSDGQVDLAAWHRSFSQHHTLVALIDHEIVGFGDIAPDGYLDRLYVHHAHQRQGIATALCDALEQAFPVMRIYTQASLTARPLFLQRGYHVLQAQNVLRKGILLPNLLMEKLR